MIVKYFLSDSSLVIQIVNIWIMHILKLSFWTTLVCRHFKTFNREHDNMFCFIINILKSWKIMFRTLCCHFCKVARMSQPNCYLRNEIIWILAEVNYIYFDKWQSFWKFDLSIIVDSGSWSVYIADRFIIAITFIINVVHLPTALI